jgi:large subunit ribosomal protein L23
MNNERIYQVLKGPVFSEKAQVLGETAGVQVLKLHLMQTNLKSKKQLSNYLVFKLLKLTQRSLKVRLNALVKH